MKIFGNILPFIGFQIMDTDSEGNLTDVQHAHWESDFFCVEWLGCGLALSGLEPRRKEKK
jgi:hypothetical protein